MIFSGKERRVKRFLKDLDVDAFSELMLDLDVLSKNMQDSDNLYDMRDKYSNPGALLALISYAGGVDLLFSMDMGDLAKYLIDLYGGGSSDATLEPQKSKGQEYYNDSISEEKKPLNQTAESAFKTWSDLLVSVHEVTDSDDNVFPEFTSARYSDDGSELLKDDEQIDDLDESVVTTFESESIIEDEDVGENFERYDVERVDINNSLIDNTLNFLFGIGIDLVGSYLNDIETIFKNIQDHVVYHYENLNKDESSYPSDDILKEDAKLRKIVEQVLPTSEEQKNTVENNSGIESLVNPNEDVSSPKRKRMRVGPGGMLTEEPDKITEERKKSNPEDTWGEAIGKTLVTLSMSDEESEVVSAESTKPLGYESGEISGASYTDLQKASLKRAVKKIQNNELFEFSLSREVERISESGDLTIRNKSLVHPIFKKVYDRFSCESILDVDDLGAPLIRGDSEDILSYIENEIALLFNNLKSGLRKDVRNTSRGAKVFEIRVEKVNIAVGNAIEAAKIWDAYNDSESSRLGLQIPVGLNLIKRIKESNIFNIIVDIVRDGSLVHYSGVKVQRQIDRKSDTIKYNVEGATEALRDAFEDIFEQQIKALVSKCLDSTNHIAWTNPFITLYAATSIRYNNIMMAAVERVSNPYSGATYISCPVCNKNIRYRNFSKKGGARIREDNDYKIREHSLVRPSREESSGGITVYHPGGIISKNELLNHPGVNIEGEIINWELANKMLASKSMFTQKSGNMARHAILKALGGKPLFSTDRYISSTKFACPMSDYLIPEGSASTSECGFSVNIDNLSDDVPFDVSDINSNFQKNIIGSSEPENIFEEISMANISDDKKDLLSNYIEGKRSGGWNFSDTHFACPCHVSPRSESPDDISSFREKHKDAFLLIPHIGFAKESDKLSAAINDTYSTNNLKWSYHPPTNSDGSEKLFSDGASGYMVCSTPTSLSSFIRDKSHPHSLSSVIESARQAGGNSEVEKVIEMLLRLGVDISDLLEMDDLFVEDLDKTSRLDAISKIMKSAMAVNISKKNNNISIINNLGLKCGHGHIFTVGQSVRVGATHAGAKISGDLLESGGLIGRVGVDNFDYISKRYFRPVTSSSELSDLNSVYESGSAYSGFKLTGVKFSNPMNPDISMSFSSANHRRLRGKVFVNTSAANREYNSVYTYDPLERVDLTSISRESAIGSSGDADAGDAVADQSLNAEDIVSVERMGEDKLIKEIFEMLAGGLEMINSLKQTSQSLNIETVLLDDEEECCSDMVVAKIKEILSDLFRDLGGKEANIQKLLSNVDELLLNRLKGQKISAIRGYGRLGIESILARIIIEDLGYDYSDRDDMVDQETLLKIKQSVSKSVDILVPRGYEYSDLFPEKNTSGAKKIVLRRRAEHVGRQIMGGTAVYFSDVMSDILRSRFSKKASSSIFSGLDIDIGEIDRESILNIDDVDISKLKSLDYLEDSVNAFISSGGDIGRLRDSYAESRRLIRTELIRFRGMVTTQKYMSLGSEIASRGIDSALSLESDDVRSNIKKYIFGEDKIINVSLKPQDKYFSGANPGEFVGGYTSPVLIPEHKEGRVGVIHLLSDGNNIKNTDGVLTEDEHQAFKNSEYSREYFLGLTNGDLPYGCEDISTSSNGFESLVKRFENSQWNPCLVRRDIGGSSPYKLSKKYKLSILDHPNTARRKDDNGVVYYENYDFGLDTSSGIQLGQQVPSTDSRGVNKLYPPSPYAPTGIGVPLPLDYDGMYSRKKGEFNIPQVFTDQEKTESYKDVKFRVPIQECSAPINIGLSSGPINAADFMKRAPKYAVPIFEEIDRIYADAIRESSKLEDGAARTLIGLAKDRIKKLHNKYRNLPFEVESGKNRTGISGDGGLRNIGGLYVPMWDYATMYKMATHPAYSIEWGGPGRYSDPDSYGKIVSFISSIYNVDLIAEALTGRTKEDYTIEDVLGGVKKDDGKDIVFASGITDSIPNFYSISSDDDNSNANMVIYTDWDYPGAEDMDVADYSRKLSRLERIKLSDNQDRLSPADIATLRGLYGRPGGPDGVQAGPYGETKSSDPTLSVYAFTARLRDFASKFVLGRARDNKESSIYAGSKFLSKISERKDGLRRIIFMSEVDSLLDEIFKK